MTRALWALLAVVVLVRFAEPILDGDVFFHMAYARQMLERGTLVLDHSAFSWTPATTDVIYCAWIGELVLYILWTLAGPWSLFVLRYAILVAVIALAARYAWRCGVVRSPTTPAVFVVLVLLSVAASVIKPELFSLLLFHATVAGYFHARLAGLEGRAASRLLMAWPPLLVLWVNVHGAFMFAAPLVAGAVIGDALNARFSPAFALPLTARRDLRWAAALSALAVAISPYGIAYPVQLVRAFVLGQVPRPDFEWNATQLPLFDPVVTPLHFAELGLLLGTALAAVLVNIARPRPLGARVDFAILLINAAYLGLFVVALRTAYFWPAVAVYSIFFLLRVQQLGGQPSFDAWISRSSAGRAISGIAVGLALFVGTRAVYEARYRPVQGGWLGFGIGTQNPVAEAEFLAAARLGPRIYNIFDSGVYLLWRLDPEYKVMTDSRSFPYLSWFDEQYTFTNGTAFESFIAKYPADVALIDFAKERCLENFRKAPEWRLVYYGQTGAIFVRGNRAVSQEARAIAPDRFDRIRQPLQASRVFEFALEVGDLDVADRVLAGIRTEHRRSLGEAYVRQAEAARQRAFRPAKPQG